MDSLKQTAERLLAQSDLVARLRPLGEPYVHGSFDLDLMVWPEIDVFLAVDPPTVATACAVTQTLSEALALRDIHIINQVDHAPRFALKDMVLLDLSTEFEGVAWKLDIGIIPTAMLPSVRKYNATLKPLLAPATAQAIVDIKRQSLASPRYRRHNWKYIEAGDWFFSGDIYRAVAFNQVTNFDEFAAFLKRTKGLDPLPA